MGPVEAESQKDPIIRRGRVDSLSLYEITDHELGILEKGSPSSIYLSFAIFLLSVASSFLVTLWTSTITSDRVFIVLVIIIIVGYALGGLLLLLWFRTRTSILDVARRVKARSAYG